MIHELARGDFGKVWPLVEPLAGYGIGVAVVQGVRQGRIFVDDPADPQTAFIFSPQVWGFLVGRPDNEAFNTRLNRLMFAQDSFARQTGMLLIVPGDPAWRPHLNTIADPRQPGPVPRLHYECEALRIDWRAILPEGFTVQRIDEALLNRDDVSLPQDVTDWIAEIGSPEEFLQRSFGFVTSHENQIVSWCMCDGVVTCNGIVAGDGSPKRRAEIGIFTVEAYRRRGLGAATTAAAVEYALANGIKTLLWNCGEMNTASIRTAEKVGFERKGDYTMYAISMEPRQHAALLRHVVNDLPEVAEAAVSSGAYAKAAALYEDLFALTNERSAEHYHLAARAFAALGDQRKALAYLSAALEQGWDFYTHTRQCKEFKSLHGTTGWAAALASLKRG